MTPNAIEHVTIDARHGAGRYQVGTGADSCVAQALDLADGNTSDEAKIVAVHQDAAGRIRPTTVAGLQRRIWDRVRVECFLERVERFLQVTIEGEVALSIECLL